MESHAVAGDHPFKGVFADAIKPALLRSGFVPEEQGAHHRRQGQGDEGGHDDRDAKRHGKFAEEPPHHIAHEEERNQRGNQRDAQGDNREPDLLGAL